MALTSVPEFNGSEGVLQPLLCASNSSSLEQALEILTEASRAAVGRAELAVRNVLPAVLKLVENLNYTSSREYLMHSLKLLRNLCAGEVANQNAFIEQNGVELVSSVLRSASLLSNPDVVVIRNSLQVLANVTLAGEYHQQAIWLKLFPNEFSVLARVRCQETSDPLCKIIYTCCDRRPGLVAELCSDSGLPIVADVIRTITSVGFGEDWFKLLLSRLCLEDIHFPPLFSNFYEGSSSKNSSNSDSGDVFSPEQAFLLRTVSEILNERIEEIRVSNEFALCVLGIFKRSVTVFDFVSRCQSGLPTGSTSIDVMGYSLLILRDICAQEGVGDLKKDSSDVVYTLLSHELIDILLSLLHDLEPPAIIKKVLKNEQLNSSSPKLCPYKGYRRDIVAVIGNCAYQRKYVQDEIRLKIGILLLLQQCVTDDDNPYLREWGIWSLRNILEGNAENQKVVADLELQGSVDVPELSRLGLRVEVDQNTRRAKLINIPGSHQKPGD